MAASQTASYADKPLPSLPSPTLTNPDMLLPDSLGDGDARSPPRTRRPPSPTYLRDIQDQQTNGQEGLRSASMQSSSGPLRYPPKKEKRGLMSRKMMLLRSRTGSGMAVNGTQAQDAQDTAPPVERDEGSDAVAVDHETSYAPTVQDAGLLAPETSDQKRFSTGASSFTSEDLAAIPSFLRKYEALGDITDDEQDYGYSASIEEGGESQRKAQEEHNSAVLSRRAEEILANAKKRLNLMEGNLRGARDLVAPLTAANLRRATSLGPSHMSPASNYGGRGRFAPDSPRNEPSSPSTYRTLHTQASSPTMGRDFAAGHSRGFSETQVPDRPHTAMARSSNLFKKGRIPVKAAEEPARLRVSQSQETLRSPNSQYHSSFRDYPLHNRTSPDSTLEPLAEDEVGDQMTPSSDGRQSRGLYRPTSTADNLREKVSSLQGKIAGLKERNREDSLRRQSMQKLRTPSPFNNAENDAPEMYYVPPPSNDDGNYEVETGAQEIRFPHSSGHRRQESQQSITLPEKGGSRNAFAEAAQNAKGRTSRESNSRTSQRQPDTASQPLHKRTASGSAVVEPAAVRYPHHQRTASRDMPGTFKDDESVHSLEYDEGLVSPLASDIDPTPDYDHIVSDDNDSIYEDAQIEQPPVVAHEDRVDAFDYEHFFLHSALGTYNGRRRGSESSDGSITSVETAKAVPQDHEDAFTQGSANYPPPTPETPEELRKIERNLYHRRTESSDSASTLQSFATADEDPSSPSPSNRNSAIDWPLPASRDSSSTATPRPARSLNNSRNGHHHPAHHRHNSSSDRADSGVGLPKHARTNSNSDSRASSATTKHRSPTTATAMQSPPMSPRPQFQDPATVAVNALLQTQSISGKPLGLKDKALLYGVVESLRKACGRLQEAEQGPYERREARRRLEEVRRVLEPEDAS